MSRERRRYEPSWPNYSNKRARQGRAVVALVVLIGIGIAATVFGPESEPPGVPGSSATSATGAGGQSSKSAPAKGAAPAGPLALVQRDGGWFVSAPLEGRETATRVSVEQVIDGDTMAVRAAQTPLRVRFYGVDTPERDEPCYAEATARTRALATGTVILVPDARQQDPGGRELRYVFTPDGRSLDATLVAEGLAKAWRADGTLRDRLVALEDDARRARRGCLWAG